MTDRIEINGAIGHYKLDGIQLQHTAESEAGELEEIASVMNPDSDDGHSALPLLRLTKQPTLTPVPRPHNAAALARSAFADANLPVVNVFVKRKKLDVRVR